MKSYSLRTQTRGNSPSLTPLSPLFSRVDSPISAQDLLSRIKQEEPQCVWDQQDLAERDIPTDPNSGEKDIRVNYSI